MVILANMEDIMENSEQTASNGKIELIRDAVLKIKYIEAKYGSGISKEEINNSDVWAIVNKDTDEVCFLLTTMKKNIWDDPSEYSVRITHISGIGTDGFNKISSILGLYLDIEAYYINNGITSINLSLPKGMKGITFFVELFKIAGFKKYKKLNFPGEFHILLKANLEEWYEKNNGKYSRIVITGEGGTYKPITKKELKKLKVI
jgi:hypothetical protein